MSKTAKERVDAILKEATGQDLSSWERYTFLPSLRKYKTISPKQEAILVKLEDKLGLTEENENEKENKDQPFLDDLNEFEPF